jgi:glycosyltransferase involved in cell wall biosynthesis
LKVGVIIPDRNDRPLFLANCLRQLENQTLKPEIIELVDYEPKSEQIDITQRYKFGYEKLKNKGLDVIAFIENDEWYSKFYLETMVNAWVEKGKPNLIGTNYTIYYHIKWLAHFTMHHSTRSSAMSTLIKADLDFKWCEDHVAYTDIYLWETLKGITFSPKNNICLGIKHGVGKCGGMAHIDKQERYKSPRGTSDSDKTFLKSTMDQESFNFFSNYFNN